LDNSEKLSDRNDTVLRERLAELENERASLRIQNEALQAFVLDATPSLNPVDPTPAVSKTTPILLPLPEKFNGNRRLFKGFLMQCNLIFTLNPNCYTTDFQKVGTIISLLSGDALAWVVPFLESQDPCLSSYSKFIARITEVFRDSEELSPGESLLKLSQGRMSVADYGVAFRCLAVHSEWNEEALVRCFFRGINSNIKNEMARIKMDLPDTYEELLRVCIRVEARLIERRFQTKQSTFRKGQSPSGSSTECQEPNSLPMQSNGTMHHEPTQLRHRGPLSREERQRRRDFNLCVYCGDANHQVNNCLKKQAVMRG
jgi:hypothetical protein